jgi:hypothetical protein
MPALSAQLESRLAQWESDDTLLESAHFAGRMAVLDDLDRCFFESEPVDADPASDLRSRARALANKLEFINNQFFHTFRHQIQCGTTPAEFRPIRRNLATTAPRGLAYDYLDDLVSGVLQFESPAEEPRTFGSESVFYQPTPARHIFHLITAAEITDTDTLIDLGSGLGHVSLLASICTGATSIGIELDPVWVASAAKCAQKLNLRNVSFLTQDARQADFSAGSVFYLYTPFTGTTLASVLESLRNQAARRPIRVCTFGPCTVAVSNQSWLRSITPPVTDQVTVFFSRS